MKKAIYCSSITLIFISAILFRCSKEKDAGNHEQEISFTITTPETKNGLAMKGASGYSLSDAKKIVLTIQNADGSSTRYSSSEVTIYEMNGVFFSQKLMLKAGAFRLTEFFLMDGNGNIIFAAPLTGSFESQFVTHPLPIPFNVVDDINIPVVVEVLSTENKSPEDFGLVSFHISQANVIDFFIAVADRESDTLLSAKLIVSAGTWSYVKMLNAVAANRVIVKDSAGIDFYNLTIEKYGYFTYSHDYPKDSLRLFNSIGNNTPLLVELERNHMVGVVTDIENNVYKTVKIGDQWWMAENLKTTTYKDGTSIPYVKDWWEYQTTPAFCWVVDDPVTYKNTYGGLYNWYAVNSGKLCPIGWHVSTNADWDTLKEFVEKKGSKLRESGTEHWALPNDEADNSTGFAALPAGYRYNSFANIGWGAYFWLPEEFDTNNGWYSAIFPTGDNIEIGDFGKIIGMSIRCVKN